MGGVGVNRLDASANHSSENERTLPPSAAETRSESRLARWCLSFFLSFLQSRVAGGFRMGREKVDGFFV